MFISNAKHVKTIYVNHNVIFKFLQPLSLFIYLFFFSNFLFLNTQTFLIYAIKSPKLLVKIDHITHLHVII
jgi:hypothetical protein